MEENLELSVAWNFIENTGAHLFLTGKAGTGKTTFLRKLQSESPKRMIVLAPTGIAAINAGGVTIHSFFQLPFAPYVPETSFSANGKTAYRYRFSKEKINIIRSIDLLVIDEISMVRADLLDAVDNVLRRYRNRSMPFGGVQLLLIGDLQQLAPVVKDEEWAMLKNYYETPYFFSSQALKQAEYCTIELTTVYRQNDSSFLELLNRIRENRCDDQVLAALNSRYIPGFRPRKEEGYIRLVTHNYQAQRINERELDLLPGRSFAFRAKIEGKFPDYAYPTDEVLELKRGTQIMFVKNDSSGEHRYYNGMIGEVTAITSGGIEVRSGDGSAPFALREEEWSNAKYVLDEETKEITEEIEGTFRQYPVKPAWAITIHKSQGLTFERAIIDASASFAHGQTYVALSRCKTLEGLVLSAPISEKAVISDAAVDAFTEQARSNRLNVARFDSLQRAYFYDLLSGLFDFNPLEQALRRYVRLIDEFLYKLYPKHLAACKEEQERFREKVMNVAQKFKLQYTRLVEQSVDLASDAALQDRVRRGAVYFKEQLAPMDAVLSHVVLNTDNKELKKKLKDAVEDLDTGFYQKDSLLEYVAQEGFSTGTYLKRKALLAIDDAAAVKKKSQQTVTGDKSRSRNRTREDRVEVSSDILHPELYKRLVAWRNAQAAELGVPVYTIIQQKAILGISNLLPTDKDMLVRIPYFGKRGVEKYGDTILEMVRAYRKERF